MKKVFAIGDTTKIRILAIVIFVLLFSVTVANAQTGYPYNPMILGSEITYARYSICGYWNDAAMELSVLQREFVDYVTIKHGTYQCQDCFGDAVLYRSIFPDCNSLVDGGSIVDGIKYIGEARNDHGQVMTPFIAKLAQEPYEGQVIQTCSIIRAGCGFCDKIIDNHCWKYQTLEYYLYWGDFVDCWRTGLKETGSSSANWQDVISVYNYVYAKWIGLVHFWFGTTDANGQIENGYEFYAISN